MAPSLIELAEIFFGSELTLWLGIFNGCNTPAYFNSLTLEKTLLLRYWGVSKYFKTVKSNFKSSSGPLSL